MDGSGLKSRFCLFEGTFRKYHDIDLPENDWKYYLSLSAKASEEFITNSGYGLYTSGGTQTAYRDLFVSEDAQQIEVVLARDYNKGLSVFHNSTFYSLNTSYGRPGLTRKIVASYLMADGTRFTDKAGWETMEFGTSARTAILVWRSRSARRVTRASTPPRSKCRAFRPA